MSTERADFAEALSKAIMDPIEGIGTLLARHIDALQAEVKELQQHVAGLQERVREIESQLP